MNIPAKEHSPGGHVLKTPIWVVVIRGFQILISLVIAGLAARLMHDAYIDEEGLAMAIAVITWVVVAYILITEKIRACYEAYHILAVVILDGLMMVLWLATFAAVAAKRAEFTVNVSVDGCFDDGSSFNSKTCFRKRSIILFKSGADMLSAIAGLGALVWILFIVTFVWTVVQFVKGRKEGRFPITSDSTTGPAATPATENYQMEPKPFDGSQQPPLQQGQYSMQPQPAMAQQHPPQGQYAPQQGQYAPQQGQYAPAAGHSQMPYQQAVSPSSGQGPYSPRMVGHPQEQQGYSQYPTQQQYQPPSSPSPVAYTHESATLQSQSPPPQELQHQPYQAQPHELPHNQYPQPENR